MAAEQKAFGVYVHWPFCLSKCPYCDFNSHVRHAAVDEDRFACAFAREIETTAARAGGRTVTSIFLGGGTPSLMQPKTVGAILDAIGRHWSVAPDVEVTLEANPTSVEATRFRGYRAAGVNRVSLGVQWVGAQFNDDLNVTAASAARQNTRLPSFVICFFPAANSNMRPGFQSRRW
jgi:oxygen-independent coproporphyrinogen-3 oxidase